MKDQHNQPDALAIIEEFERISGAQPAPDRPQGVIPDLLAPGSGPSMSLGSRRLCTDPASRPNKRRGEWKVTDAYENPIVACIEWRRVTFYRDRSKQKPKEKEPRPTDQNLTRGEFNGYMSPATKRYVRRIVSTWLRAVMIYRAEIKRRYDPGRAYPVFLTVTLPSDQVHPDKQITRECLTPFIAWLKRSHGIEHYFWRAEAQENGRVHYHILTDRYIRAEDVQAMWNKCVNKLGYVDRYYERTGEAMPPSTEIHAVRDKVKDRKTGEYRSVDPVDYLMEYVMDTPAPEDQNSSTSSDQQGPRKLIGRQRLPDGRIITYITRAIEGRVWGMSDALRAIREPRAEASVRLITALEDGRQRNSVRRIDMEHATMYFGDVGLTISRAHRGMWGVIKEYYVNTFAYLYPAQLPPEYREGRTLWDPGNTWIDLQEFALYERVIDEAEAEPDHEAAIEAVTWFWTVIDGQKTHTTMSRLLDRYPALRKYGLDQWTPHPNSNRA